MALRIVATHEERLVCAPVREAVCASIEGKGAALVLVPSFGCALEVQRSLADAGTSLGVSVTTPAAWVRERWEAWGDGRAIVDAITLSLLAQDVLGELAAAGDARLRPSPGLVDLLSSLVSHAAPWLPILPDGSVDEAACAAARLTRAETALMGAAGALGARLQALGYVCASEASQAVPALLAREGVSLPDVTCVGWSQMRRAEVELVRALAASTELSFVARLRGGPASEELAALVRRLGGSLGHAPRPGHDPQVPRDEGLAELLDALYTGRRLAVRDRGPVELLLASGPVAEAELVARRALAAGGRHDGGARPAGDAAQVAIAVPDTTRARRELFDKLAARGASVRMQGSRPLLECPTAVAFLTFAETVARLAELEAGWPEPRPGRDGLVPQLGSMDWWPPSALVDLLLSGASGMDAARAWALDARWRGNRLLTPAQVLASLRSERETSAPVARATEELLRGHVGTAASRLLGPLMAAGAARPGAGASDAAAGMSGEVTASLQALMRIAVAVREVVRARGQESSGPQDLGGVVRLCRWAAEGVSVSLREEVVGSPGMPCVRLLSPADAARLDPGSVDTLIVCGLTTAESPIGRSDDLEGTLLAQLGVEPVADPMAHARAAFHALASVPARHLVLERSLTDADSKPAYPAVMLSELLDVYYGASPVGTAADGALPVAKRVECDLAENLSRARPTPPMAADPPSAEGALTAAARSLLLVPQQGSAQLPGGKPVLSASQIETYLDCPYKWFSLRRLRLGTVDAGHGGAEMGTFAHRVLEVTHRELLARALESERPGAVREELLAELERDPARPLPASRVSEDSLPLALSLLEDELDLHGEHLRMVRNPRPAQQILVPHGLAEEVQEERLRQDLRSLMPYQAGILAGFEPRLFEWGFGRRDELVEYAGAYFTGTVDRIDVSPEGDAVIIDYKHKSPTGFAAEYDVVQEGVLEGESIPRRVQSLIYAQVVRRAFAGRLRLVGTTYLATKSPHALAGAADASFVGRVFGQLSAKRLPQVCVPTTESGDLGMYALLDQTERLVADQVARMLAGDVEARPRDKEACQFCPVMHCERRVAR